MFSIVKSFVVSLAMLCIAAAPAKAELPAYGVVVAVSANHADAGTAGAVLGGIVGLFTFGVAGDAVGELIGRAAGDGVQYVGESMVGKPVDIDYLDGDCNLRSTLGVGAEWLAKGASVQVREYGEDQVQLTPADATKAPQCGDLGGYKTTKAQAEADAVEAKKLATFEKHTRALARAGKREPAPANSHPDATQVAGWACDAGYRRVFGVFANVATCKK